jgi:hypothetical protein
MTILSWFQHSGATTQKSRRSAMRRPGTNFDRRRRPAPPLVELLEDRTLLSAPSPLTSLFSGSGGRLGYAQTAGSLSTFRGGTFDGKSSSGKITHNLLGTFGAARRHGAPHRVRLRGDRLSRIASGNGSRYHEPGCECP